jgi:hypothetical protein
MSFVSSAKVKKEVDVIECNFLDNYGVSNAAQAGEVLARTMVGMSTMESQCSFYLFP